jgi:hypothetical protein
MVEGSVYKERLFGIGGCPALLPLLILLYSNGIDALGKHVEP